jgi:uncharacterized damage-inducible protein DinB
MDSVERHDWAVRDPCASPFVRYIRALRRFDERWLLEVNPELRETMTASTNSAPHSTAEQVPASALFADLDMEFSATRKLLERFPDEHADWRPHDRSWTLATLAAHVAELPGFGEVIAAQPEYDFAQTPYVASTARTKAELLELFDGSVAGLKQALAALDVPALMATWRLRAGDVEYQSGPRHELIRRIFMSHHVHHRGQLTVYYRLLGVPVPGPYGPSADEG